MSHGFFITASFAIAAIGVIWLVLSSYFAMRKSETLADDLREQG